jgi:ribosomal protein L11 methyltransferase
VTGNGALAGLWTEMALRVQPGHAEAVAEFLQEATGAGVTIEPAIEALGPDEGYTLDYEAPVVLKAYIDGEAPAATRRALRRRLRRRGLTNAVQGRIVWRTIREEDWAETWKEHYDIERVGRVIIRPAWREYTATAGEVVVSLDPGMAFGTGQHATTRMCLLALQELAQPDDRVLDLGTGSGILALAAIALGVQAKVYAADTEEQAVQAATANAALNDASDRIEVAHGSLDTMSAHAPFDLILANINGATITALASDLATALKSGGVLVAAGIIDEREAQCLAALRAAGLVIEGRLAEGDWRGFICRQPR